MGEINRALVASHPNGRASRARHHVRTEPERFNDAHHAVDLGLPGTGVHYDQHDVKRRLLTGKNTPRSNLTHVGKLSRKTNRRQRPLDFGTVHFVLRRKL